MPSRIHLRSTYVSQGPQPQCQVRIRKYLRQEMSRYANKHSAHHSTLCISYFASRIHKTILYCDMLFRLPFKKRNRGFLEEKKRYRGILDAVDSFVISVFSETFNTLSLCIFELFYAVNVATSNRLSFDVFLCYIFCYFHCF